MPGVKNIFFLVFTTFGFFGISAQEITGNYKVIDQTLVVGDIGNSYNFKIDGKFENITYEHLEKKSISGGDYKVLGDTLVLKYKPQDNNPPGDVKVIKKEDINDSEILISNIRVFNDEGEPQPGVNILVKNKEKKLVTGFVSDRDGRFPTLSFYDNYIHYFTFSWIGHREVTIPADGLFGYSTDIEVHLKDSTVTYYNPDRTIKYLIIRRTDIGLELQSLIGNPDKPIILRKL